MTTFTRRTSLFLTGSLFLAACAPSILNSSPAPIVYRAQVSEVEQAIREVSTSFASLSGFQSLVLVSSQSKDGQIFLTSPVRVNQKGQVVSAVNVLDERELIFLLTGKDGQTTLDYRMKGQLDQHVKTVLNALDRRFERVSLP